MSLIARWRFEPGNFLVDSSGNSNTLVNGAAYPTNESDWRVDGQGSAKFVRASSQRLYITDANLSAGFPCRHDDVSPVLTFTFCGWLKPAVTNVTQGFINKWGSTAGVHGYQLWMSSGSGLKFTLYGTDAASREKAHATALSAGVVYFFAVGYNESTLHSCIYLRDINANVIGSDLASIHHADWVGLNVPDVSFVIGAQVASTANNFDGHLDDIRCYSNEYLTPAQVTQICRQSSGRAGKRLMMGG